METESFKTSLSVQAETLQQLDARMAKIRAEVSALMTSLGFLTQEYLILGEAMKETLKDLNGGVAPLVINHQKFPQLNHYG